MTRFEAHSQMRRSSLRSIVAIIGLAAFVGWAGASPDYDLSWHTMDCGGGGSDESPYLLDGTIGQHDAATPGSTGGGYTLVGGFWNGVVESTAGSQPVQPACLVSDLNCDGAVNGIDLGILLSNWSVASDSPGCFGSLPCNSDLNRDGLVNGIDLGMLLADWTS